MRKICLRLLLVAMAIGLIAAATCPPGPPPSDEEFVGPFPSWQSVKSAPCNATGDGSTDDTSAIQTCLNLLGSSQPTIYFPAGVYRITSGLTLAGQINVNI